MYVTYLAREAHDATATRRNGRQAGRDRGRGRVLALHPPRAGGGLRILPATCGEMGFGTGVDGRTRAALEFNSQCPV